MNVIMVQVLGKCRHVVDASVSVAHLFSMCYSMCRGEWGREGGAGSGSGCNVDPCNLHYSNHYECM